MLFAVQTEQNDDLRARDGALLALLIYAGLRVQEICDLQLRDLDLAGGTVTVRSVKPGKLRRVPLHPRAMSLLAHYIERVRCPRGLPPIGSEAERELLMARMDKQQPRHPFEPGMTQRVIQRTVERLGWVAAEHLRAAADREEIAEDA